MYNGQTIEELMRLTDNVIKENSCPDGDGIPYYEAPEAEDEIEQARR